MKFGSLAQVGSPDASWIRKERIAALPREQQKRFYYLCPDFVIELRSSTDRINRLKAKMEEYIANGSRLGWLLDPMDNRAIIYRPGQPPERIDTPGILSGDPVLPGFKFDFKEIL